VLIWSRELLHVGIVTRNDALTTSSQPSISLNLHPSWAVERARIFIVLDAQDVYWAPWLWSYRASHRNLLHLAKVIALSTLDTVSEGDLMRLAPAQVTPNWLRFTTNRINSSKFEANFDEALMFHASNSSVRCTKTFREEKLVALVWSTGRILSIRHRLLMPTEIFCMHDHGLGLLKSALIDVWRACLLHRWPRPFESRCCSCSRPNGLPRVQVDWATSNRYNSRTLVDKIWWVLYHHALNGLLWLATLEGKIFLLHH